MDLVDVGTLTAQIADTLRQAVADRKNILISGGTGTGKTTLLNMILRSLIGDYEPVKFDPYNPAAGVHKME